MNTENSHVRESLTRLDDVLRTARETAADALEGAGWTRVGKGRWRDPVQGDAVSTEHALSRLRREVCR